MFAAFLACSVARKRRLDDEEARAYLRSQQAFRQLRQRSREREALRRQPKPLSRPS